MGAQPHKKIITLLIIHTSLHSHITTLTHYEVHIHTSHHITRDLITRSLPPQRFSFVLSRFPDYFTNFVFTLFATWASRRAPQSPRTRPSPASSPSPSWSACRTAPRPCRRSWCSPRRTRAVAVKLHSQKQTLQKLILLRLNLLQLNSFKLNSHSPRKVWEI